jgi:hypothetical protein
MFLHGISWQLVTNISGQPISTILKGQAVQVTSQKTEGLNYMLTKPKFSNDIKF